MNLLVKLRRGEGPFWGTLKGLARKVLSFHLPVFGPTRMVFAFLYLFHVTCRQGWHAAWRFFWNEPLFRSQCDRVGPGFRMSHLPFIHGSGRIVVGDHVHFGGMLTFIFGNRAATHPVVVIGDHSFIGHGASFNTSASITVGRHCLLSGDVRVTDYDGHPTDADRRRAGEPTPPESIRPVEIGDDVWIGQGATILKGVRIGDRAIIGAGAIVTRDVPPDTVVAGNPARAVKHLGGTGLAANGRPESDPLCLVASGDSRPRLTP